VLLQYLTALLFTLTLVAAGAHGAEERCPLIRDHRTNRAEQPPERELRREDEPEKEQGQDQDDRPRAIEILGQDACERHPEVPARTELLAGDFDAAERQRQERRRATAEERAAEGLGVRRIETAAPEVVPSDHRDHDRRQVSGVSNGLVRQLGEEGANPSREVGRRGVRTGIEEPDRIRSTVTDERDQPNQRQREQRDADNFAETSRQGPTHVRSP
jgi:hypothetical protein